MLEAYRLGRVQVFPSKLLTRMLLPMRNHGVAAVKCCPPFVFFAKKLFIQLINQLGSGLKPLEKEEKDEF